MSSIEIWESRVREHHAQSIRARGGQDSTGDFWHPFSSCFRADPSRTDDPVVNRLLMEVTSQDTVLDVGGGGGRFALPLALKCRHVSAVDPSDSMVALLLEGAREAHIQNISVTQRKWEEAEVDPVEVVLCSHVLYGVEEVQPFVRKLDAHALKRVLVLMFMDAPQGYLAPLWEWVHREDRIQLPGLRELPGVLWEMGIYPDLQMVDTQRPQVYETWERAQEEFRRRLYVEPGTEKDWLLTSAMEELLERVPDGFMVRGAGPRRVGLLLWRSQGAEGSRSQGM